MSLDTFVVNFKISVKSCSQFVTYYLSRTFFSNYSPNIKMLDLCGKNVVFLMSCGCWRSVALPHGGMGLSADPFSIYNLDFQLIRRRAIGTSQCLASVVV